MARFLLLSAVLFVACGDDTAVDAGLDARADASQDSAVDAPMDSGVDAHDSSVDTNPPPGSMRVVSYNLRNALSDLDEWEARRGVLVDALLAESPDLIGVQEADEPWMDYLPSMLADHDVVGVGRDDGATAGEFAAIFFRRSRFSLVESGTFWLSETPDEPSYGWGAQHRRICTFATLSDAAGGETFTIYNTHLDHEVEVARENGMALILQRIATGDHPAILTGDMNFLEGEPLYHEVTRELRDAKMIAARSMSHGTLNYFRPVNTQIVIDFVFLSESFVAHEYRVPTSAMFGELPVSDHYPVVVDLSF